MERKERYIYTNNRLGDLYLDFDFIDLSGITPSGKFNMHAPQCSSYREDNNSIPHNQKTSTSNTKDFKIIIGLLHQTRLS